MFGGSVQFSIPQFGDFFNDMVMNITLAQTQAVAGGTVPAFPAFIGAQDQVSGSTSQTSGTQNTTTGVYTKYTQEWVDIAGNVYATGAAVQNYVRYCEWPGQRLFKNVKFEVNGNPLDEYTAEAYIYHQKFKVQPNKLTGWKRLLGQEVATDAWSDILTVAGQTNYPSLVSNLLDQGGNAVSGCPTNQLLCARQQSSILNGPQTPQLVQPALDLWVPLIFWFNKDPRLSIASVSIPYGQRFITILLEAQNNILFSAPGNLFLRTTTELTTSAGAGKGTNSALAVTDYKRYVQYAHAFATGAGIDPTQQITLMELYINNIFVNPEIHDIYIKRIGFSLIRVNRLQITRDSNATDNVLLSQLKWPIEYLFVALRPAVNITNTNLTTWRDWHRLTGTNTVSIDKFAKAHTNVVTDDTVAWNAGGVKNKTSFSQETTDHLYYLQFTQTMDLIQLQAHGINIFQQYKSQFFRDYMSYTYGGSNIITPEDPGAFLLNFCLYPGTYQPSGHINVSRAREFYLMYTSSYCSAAQPCDLITLASALNFLLISDGSAVLRYST